MASLHRMLNDAEQQIPSASRLGIHPSDENGMLHSYPCDPTIRNFSTIDKRAQLRIHFMPPASSAIVRRKDLCSRETTFALTVPTTRWNGQTKQTMYNYSRIFLCAHSFLPHPRLITLDCKSHLICRREIVCSSFVFSDQ